MNIVNHINTPASAHPSTGKCRPVWDVLATVNDPEIPVLSILDLGIVRQVDCSEDEEVPLKESEINITITPTYSGCPAMDVITMNIRFSLLQAGYKNIHIKSQLSPAWTTDWMSEAGKQKLKAYSIAPPNPQQTVCTPEPFQQELAVQCPRCNSYNTRLVSQFGSTACKSQYKCLDCQEPFDHFKCH